MKGKWRHMKGNERKRKGKWTNIQENEQIERKVTEKGRNWKKINKSEEKMIGKRKETKGKARKWAKMKGTR